MARSGIRRVGLLTGLVLAVGLVSLVVYDVAKTPPRPSWEPVVRRSALAFESAPSSAACAGLPSRWMVLGWDGASWDLIGPLIEQGRMPHLAELIRRGTHGDLYGFKPSLSPALWTSVATGVSPDRHGIRGFDKRKHRSWRRLERVRRLGKVERKLYSNADRRVRSAWNLLTETGRRSLVVGYHNTFPAEAVRGLMVSNYLVQVHMSSLMRANRTLPAALLSSLVHPPQATDEVLRVERRVRLALAEEIARFGSFSPAELRRLLDAGDAEGPGERGWDFFLRQAYLFDTFHAEVALEFLERVEPELAWVHFQGLDLVSHKFLYFHDPERFRGTGWSAEIRRELDRLVPRHARTVSAFYAYLDEWLGRFLAARTEDTAVLVLSDHGFEPTDDPWSSGGHDGAPPGIWVMQGPGIRPGVRADGTVYDVLPTLLASMDLPLSRELEGRPLELAFCQALEPKRVETYESEQRFQPEIAPPDGMTRRIEEQLRSLGYIR